MPAFLKPCWSTSASRFHGPGSFRIIMLSFRFEAARRGEHALGLVGVERRRRAAARPRLPDRVGALLERVPGRSARPPHATLLSVFLSNAHWSAWRTFTSFERPEVHLRLPPLEEEARRDQLRVAACPAPAAASRPRCRAGSRRRPRGSSRPGPTRRRGTGTSARRGTARLPFQ